MSRRIKRLAVSVFLVGHIAAVVLTNLPDCPLRRSLGGLWVDAYLMPTGLWQGWGMFAPEPTKDTLTLEATVLDARGLIHKFAFPRMMDQSAWAGFCGGYQPREVRRERGGRRRRSPTASSPPATSSAP